MPISITTGALHHQNFNKFEVPRLKFLELSRFSSVPGIFSLPPCIVFALKGKQTEYPVLVTDWKGSLTGKRRNATLDEILPILTSTKGNYYPSKIPVSVGHYFELFKEGATIVPHNFWFVDLVMGGVLGADRTQPLLETSKEAERVAKRPWKGKMIKGQVEARFIFAVFLGKDLIPFGTLAPRQVVLPLILHRGTPDLLDVETLQSRGFPLMAKWLSKTQLLWETLAPTKSKQAYPRIINRLDYQRTLTAQAFSRRYIVIYNARGANVMCTVIDREQLPKWNFDRMSIVPTDIVADSTNFFYATDDKTEAHYLCAILNTPSVSKAVKPFQPRGAYGARDIGRRPLMLSIPSFNSKNASHLQLASLSEQAHSLVTQLPFSSKGFRTRRHEAIKALASTLAKLDQIINSLGMAEVSRNLRKKTER